jgi:hypothetical protein
VKDDSGILADADDSLVYRYLTYLMQPKTTSSSQNNGDAPKDKDKEYSSRFSGALSSSIYSIGDLFKDLREGSRSVKFPKDLLKVLELKLQDIAMGKDPAYVYPLAFHLSCC